MTDRFQPSKKPIKSCNLAYHIAYIIPTAIRNFDERPSAISIFGMLADVTERESVVIVVDGLGVGLLESPGIRRLAKTQSDHLHLVDDASA